jgi:hypothetical protein
MTSSNHLNPTWPGPSLVIWSRDSTSPLISAATSDLPPDSTRQTASSTEESFTYPDPCLQTSLSPYPLLAHNNDEDMTDVEDWAPSFDKSEDDIAIESDEWRPSEKEDNLDHIEDNLSSDGDGRYHSDDNESVHQGTEGNEWCSPDEEKRVKGLAQSEDVLSSEDDDWYHSDEEKRVNGHAQSEDDLSSNSDEWYDYDEDETLSESHAETPSQRAGVFLDKRERVEYNITGSALVCSFPDCAHTFLGKTHSNRFHLDYHRSRHEPVTLPCGHPDCQGDSRLYNTPGLIGHQSLMHRKSTPQTSFKEDLKVFLKPSDIHSSSSSHLTADRPYEIPNAPYVPQASSSTCIGEQLSTGQITSNYVSLTV